MRLVQRSLEASRAGMSLEQYDAQYNADLRARTAEAARHGLTLEQYDAMHGRRRGGRS